MGNRFDTDYSSSARTERRGFLSRIPGGGKTVSVGGALLAIGLLTSQLGSCTNVDAGQAAVRTTWSDGTLNRVYGQGLHTASFFGDFWKYTIRTQELNETGMIVNAKGGVPITVDGALWFHIVGDLPAVHNKFGGHDQLQQRMLTAFSAESRAVIGNYSVDELLESAKDKIGESAKKAVQQRIDAFAPGMVVVDDVLFRKTDPDPAVKTALAAKEAARQENDAMQWKVARQIQENDRVAKVGAAVRELGWTPEQYIAWLNSDAIRLAVEKGELKVFLAPIGSGASLPLESGEPKPQPPQLPAKKS
jgi:SPFH domain/Band 7 family protein